LDERLLIGKRVLDGASYAAWVGAISRRKAGECQPRLAEGGEWIVRSVRRYMGVASGAIAVFLNDTS
jgi:hypothetical protein